MVNSRAHVIVSGQVQGVFFRQSTREKSQMRGVTGWVRNLPDGRVEAVFEGEEEDVKALVDFCRKGPRGAVITNVDVAFERFSGEFQNFRITY
ncbi:MAG TPA: acylphosphatase [Candidatus Limnocylindrales bacterium]|nr:acylphosphatase [Candidatus Limnocylindrales bacterium]